MHPLVTVITPTTGASYLAQCVASVAAQTYPNVQHLVVVDGEERLAGASAILKDAKVRDLDLIALPYATGKDRYNGHRIYGAASYIARGEFICFLDEDNWYDPRHVEALMACMTGNTKWAFSLRKIVDQAGNYVCNDDCESLGLWESCVGDGDFLVDTSCYLMPTLLAVNLTPLWYRKFREPGVACSDRAIMQMLHGNRIPGRTSGEYTLNYRTGNTGLSVRAEFFLTGNERMKARHPSGFPWVNAAANAAPPAAANAARRPA